MLVTRSKMIIQCCQEDSPNAQFGVFSRGKTPFVAQSHFNSFFGHYLSILTLNMERRLKQNSKSYIKVP